MGEEHCEMLLRLKHCKNQCINLGDQKLTAYLKMSQKRFEIRFSEIAQIISNCLTKIVYKW